MAVEPWSWSASNGDASASQTEDAYTAITQGSTPEIFSYLVWNDLVNKTYEACVESGGVWISSYASLSSTRMTSSSKTLTAARFNSLRYNIGFRYSTGITDVESGDAVLGSYFITLASSLNSWINNI